MSGDTRDIWDVRALILSGQASKGEVIRTTRLGRSLSPIPITLSALTTNMENFVNMGRQFLQGQGGAQSQQGAQGVQDFGFHPDHAASHASSHDVKNGDASGSNTSIFSQVTSMLHGKHQQGEIKDDLDHNQLLSTFKKVQQGQKASSQEVGQASAVNAVKQFFGNNEHKEQGGINALVGKAMSIAGQHASGSDKHDAMNHASETIMKMAMKHKMHNMLGGYNEGVSELMDFYT